MSRPHVISFEEDFLKIAKNFPIGVFLCFFFLSSCATPAHTAFESIRLGQRKSDVVELMGSPQKSKRLKGQDHWEYSFRKGQDEITKKIVFEEGRVVDVQAVPLETALERDLKKTTSMKEYEEKIRASRLKDQTHSNTSEPDELSATKETFP
ncbi:MAG: hypothetical protein KDD35_02375 [Bdellovibrionales bacterium]|nr:hypothetical protein [Bdellovibrionales bacterium]